MNIEIIAIGDELLIGQVTDTNSGWIARHLNLNGWELSRVTLVRDRGEDIKNAINDAFSRVSVVLMTGGLGPTKDDITKHTLCELYGCGMRCDEHVQAMNEERFARRGFAMNTLTRDQALVPDACEVIYNPVGTAPVMWFERDSTILVAMPGVPSEMQYAITHEVLPRLRSRFGENSVIRHATCLVRGITESALAIKLEDFENELPEQLHLAYLPKPGVIRLRLTAVATIDDGIEEKLQYQFDKLVSLLDSYVFCLRDVSLAGALGLLLKEKNMTIATAESCTGGNIAHELTLVPGSSSYYKGSVVSYANEVKTYLLGVTSQSIDDHGVVSLPVVEQMAVGVQHLMNVDCAIATSGIAGPDGGSDSKPIGMVAIAVACRDKIQSTIFTFGNEREKNIERFTHTALLQMVNLLCE